MLDSARQPNSPPAGFALVEVLIVLAVIAILAGAMAEPTIANDRAERVVQARAALARIGAALRLHVARTGAFPSTLTNAAFLRDSLGCSASDPILRDPFRAATLRYGIVARRPDVAAVWSVGQDRVDSGVNVEPLAIRVAAREVGDPIVRSQLRQIAAVIGVLQHGGNPGAGLATLPTDVDARRVRDRYGSRLRRENGGLTVRSAGADRRFGTADDLVETAT